MTKEQILAKASGYSVQQIKGAGDGDFVTVAEALRAMEELSDQTAETMLLKMLNDPKLKALPDDSH